VDPNNLAIAISVRRARLEDAAALAQLVNRAYEVEGFFVDGSRTSADEIAQLIRKGTFLVLERGPILAAAVYVDTSSSRDGDPDAAGGGYIGMLSVEPSLQGMGLGTRLVRIAEAMCEAMGSSSVRLRIVNLREELARWYRGLGYREVGTSPYDRPVKQPCHFIEMHKWLAAADAPSLDATAAAVA
jgi:ribosomal protein S18 acetylase RimI-like enzyme